MTHVDEWIQGFLNNTPLDDRPLLSVEEAEEMMERILADDGVAVHHRPVTRVEKKKRGRRWLA